MNTLPSCTAVALCAAALAGAAPAEPAPGIAVEMGTARLLIDGRGRVAALTDAASGRNLAVPGGPFCRMETDTGSLLPEAAARTDAGVVFSFPGGIALAYTITPGAGFSVWELAEVRGIALEAVQSVRLCDLTLAGLPIFRRQLNAVSGDTATVAVMAARVNVCASGVAGAERGGNREGVTHQFVPVPADRPGAAGRQAARFAAASTRSARDGWAVRSRPLGGPRNLTGLKAVKAWVRGDGRGELLKIQLYDGKGGYRDDYIPVTFTGWQEVVCSEPALNSLDAAHVTTLSFYYNGMPPNQSVECLLDDVRAVVAGPEGEREVVLEDFEDPRCPLWNAEGASLWVETLQRHGILPAAFGIVACPNARLVEVMPAFQQAAGLPSPRPGGVWNKVSPWVRRSYLFITSFAEQDTDETIRWARRGGFPMCLIGDGSWNQNRGHYDVNTTNFPGGLEALQRCADRFRAAGIRVGLHFLAASVYPEDPYARPTPDPRLVKDARIPLAADIDAAADFIPTEGPPPAGFPDEDGGYMGNGTFVQIDDEIIQYSERRLEPPCGFAGCRRGANRTAAAPHARGAPVAHLLRSYGYFLFDLDSTLADEVVSNVARVANAIRADMLYFDGSERLQGEHWYYNAKLHYLYYTKLENKDILLQGSSASHFSWHAVARNASADGHGDVKGYLDERLPSLKWFEANLMPIDIGWYYVYSPDVTADQFDYILQKCLGFGASISVQTNPARLRTHPEMGPIFDLVNTYERLRLSGQVPADLCALLREPGREYRLLRNPLRLRRTVFGPWTDLAAGAMQAEFQVAPPAPGARLGVQVRCGGLAGPGAAYRGAEAVVLESFDDLAPYTADPANQSARVAVGLGAQAAASPGVTHELTLVEGGPESPRCAAYTATDPGPGGGWSCVGRRFDPPLDLSAHQGIGFWLKGDGKGGSFKLQIRQGANATDYYIRNDFAEWRYLQLARPEKPQPHVVDYSRIDSLLFYYNGLPGRTTVTCLIDDIKALPRLDEADIRNPELAANGTAAAFACTLRPGERLVWFPGEGPFVVPTDQSERRTLPQPADIPVGEAARATLRLGAGSTGQAAFRWVLDLPEEHALPEAALDTPLPPL